jgi:hypothetical protein
VGETNYNVKILVDVQGKKVMDALAGGGGTGNANKTGPKSLTGGIGAASTSLMKGEGFGTAFTTLTKSVTGLAAVIGIGVGILLMAVSNSKILTTIFGTIGRLLGFLMDVILLPLMPVIMMLTRWMYQMIIQFKNFTKNLSLESLLEMGLSINVLTMPVSWIVNLIKWALGEGDIQTAVTFTIGILKGVGDWLWDIAKWIFLGTLKLVNSVVRFTLNIGSAITGVLAGAADFMISLLKYLWGLGGGPSITKIALDFIANPVGELWNLLMGIWNGGKTAWNTIANLSGGILPTLDSGGTVTSTGLAVVHKGETYSGVTASGQPASGTGGGNTYIFNNYATLKTEYEMFLKFKDFLRQQGKTIS